MREISSKKKFPAMRKILRLFEFTGACAESSIDHNGKSPATDPVSSNRFNVYTVKAANSALLEAERKKAEALMQRQKHSFIC